MTGNIYLVLNGNSIDDSKQIIGTESSLDKIGIQYKDKLFNFFYNQNILKDVVVLTSKEKQSIETISFFNQVKELDCLYKMNYGNYNGKTNNNFFESKNYEDFRFDSFNFQFPNGESYKEIKNRVLSIMFELNKIITYDDVIICASRPILQCIYSIFNDESNSKIAYIDLNHNSIIKIRQGFNGFTCDSVSLYYDEIKFQ
jgi:broad specificity phosphatase PhoE